MKTKVLAVLGLTAVVGFGACKSATNTNTVMNTNTNVAVATPTAVTKTTDTAVTDPNLKPKIEAALKAKGFADVTVDTTTTPATLRGSAAKDKIPEVIQTAQEANGGKPVKSELQGK